MFATGCWLVLASDLSIAQRVPVKVPKQGVFATSLAQEMRSRGVTPENWIEASSLPHISSYLAVLPFDALVAMMTFVGLWALKDVGPMRAACIIVGHLALTCVLAGLCFGCNLFVGDYAINHNMTGLRFLRRTLELQDQLIFNHECMVNTNRAPWVFAFSDRGVITNLPSGFKLSDKTTVLSYRCGDTLRDRLGQSPLYFWNLLRGRPTAIMTHVTCMFRDGRTTIVWDHYVGYYTALAALLLTAGTLTIPALLIVFMLAFMLVARIVLSGVRWLLMYYFDLATESNLKEFMPATLLGLAFSVLLAILKCVAQCIVLVHRHLF